MLLAIAERPLALSANGERRVCHSHSLHFADQHWQLVWDQGGSCCLPAMSTQLRESITLQKRILSTHIALRNAAATAIHIYCLCDAGRHE